jgi:hypothetical protein
MVRRKLLSSGLDVPAGSYLWCNKRNIFVTIGWCNGASEIEQSKDGEFCLDCTFWKVELKAGRFHLPQRIFWCKKRVMQMYKAVCNVRSFTYNPNAEECFKCTDWFVGKDSVLQELFISGDGKYLDPGGIYATKLELAKAIRKGKSKAKAKAKVERKRRSKLI